MPWISLSLLKAEDPPENAKRRFSYWPPREGDIEDAFAAQDHEVEDDSNEQSEDAQGSRCR